MKMKLMTAFLIIGLITAFQPAMAEEKQEEANAAKLEEIVVTATRSEVKKEEVPAVVEVIGKLDLDTTVDRNIVRILKKNSSIDVIDYPGVLSGISIRGFRPEFSGITKHSLVLIDGRPAGATNLATILKDNVERVEILKGPASALYGAEAMGGVVNIITKRSKGKIKTHLTGGGGSFSTHYESIASGGKINDRLDFDASVSNKNQNTDFRMGNGHKRDNTGYKERYGNLRLGSSFTGDWRLDIKGDWYAGRDIATPGPLYYEDRRPSEKDIDRYGGDISMKGKIGSNEPLLTVYASHEDTEYTREYEGQPHYKNYESETEWWGAQLQDCFHFLDNDITIGADYQDIDIESKSYNSDGTRKAPYSPDNERENVGVFADAFLRLFDERLILNTGIRYDWFELTTKKTPLKTDFHPGSETFDHASPRAGLKYFITNDRVFQFHTTIGTAFVPPQANQMAGYSEREVSGGIMINRGNPGLDPEKSLTWDAGLSFQKKVWGIFADITYFHTDVDDKISKVKASDTETTYDNSDEAEIHGLEFELSVDAGRIMNQDRTLEFFINGTRLFSAVEKVPGENERDIHNVSHWKLNTGVRYDDGMFFGKFLVRYMGKRKDYDWYTIGYPVITYDDFTVCDLEAGVKFLKHHRVKLSVENIFDRYYYEKPEFPLPGRAIYAEYSFNF